MDTSEKQDEILPQYNIITEENQYEFIIWCSELKPPSISILKFNMLIQINMEKWIYQNNITWQYAYANTIDTLKAQQEIENSIKQEEQELEQAEQELEEQEEEDDEDEDRKKKPLDKIKRRELFAKRAEERQKYKKRKSI
tara:strand:+ start:7 stop:426 length:420 start_codon:yes stop_codon:yes gene_type:complete